METNGRTKCAAADTVSGDAVGMPNVIQNRQWYIAIVNNNTELKSGERLQCMGYDVYVPVQQQTVRRSTGRMKTVNRIVFSSIVFIHATERERKEAVTAPFIHRFMTNRANREDQFNRHPLAVVPDDQIARLKFMLYNAEADVEFVQRQFDIGSRVRVIRGKLLGLEGNVLENANGEAYILVGFDILGYAKTRINTVDLEKII